MALENNPNRKYMTIKLININLLITSNSFSTKSIHQTIKSKTYKVN